MIIKTTVWLYVRRILGRIAILRLQKHNVIGFYSLFDLGLIVNSGLTHCQCYVRRNIENFLGMPGLKLRSTDDEC